MKRLGISGRRASLTTDLAENLKRLGLSEYLEVLIEEGFDTWETVLDITESDLVSLDIETGYRSKLQCAIAESRRQFHDPSRPIAPTKQKYTRRPKTCRNIANFIQPDEYAPQRPRSAYVLFSNDIRESLKDQKFSFTEIAKIVGERWQVLPKEAQEAYQRQADAAKENYCVELAEYEKSCEYGSYQKYLNEFKAKQTTPNDGVKGRHTKSKARTKTSTPSGAYGYSDRVQSGELSKARLSSFIEELDQTQQRLTLDPSQATGHLHMSKSVPISKAGIASLADPGLPILRLPDYAALGQEGPDNPHLSATTCDSSQRNAEFGIPVCSSSYKHLPTNASNALPSRPSGDPVDLSVSRSAQESAQLSHLAYGKSSLAIENSHRYTDLNHLRHLLPSANTQEVSTLLQPVPSLGSALSPLDPPAHTLSPGQQPQEILHSSSFITLIRAGEMARITGTGIEDK